MESIAGGGGGGGGLRASGVRGWELGTGGWACGECRGGRGVPRLGASATARPTSSTMKTGPSKRRHACLDNTCARSVY